MTGETLEQAYHYSQMQCCDFSKRYALLGVKNEFTFILKMMYL